jgi:DNA replication protein DnaC
LSEAHLFKPWYRRTCYAFCFNLNEQTNELKSISIAFERRIKEAPNTQAFCDFLKKFTKEKINGRELIFKQGIINKNHLTLKVELDLYSTKEDICDTMENLINLTREPIIKFLGEKMKQTTQMEQTLAELLEQSKNLILTGAPGTGKTYLAKQIAIQMIFEGEQSSDDEDDLTEEEKKYFKEQCNFVQFHPSYDYTDFVEGLRPIKKNSNEDEGNIGFELR